jgi:hypothetical protein
MIDWEIRAYTLLACLSWMLVLLPGDGGASEGHVDPSGAVAYLLLLFFLWKGRRWAGIVLAIYALLAAASVGLIGVSSWVSSAGALMLIALAQFLLLCSWVTRPPDELRFPGA